MELDIASFLNYDWENISLRELKDIFSSLTRYLVDYFGFPTAYEKITLDLSKKPLGEKNSNVFDIGVSRRIDDNTILLTIHPNNKQFFPFILLREAFYFFLPPILLTNKAIRIFINHLVELLLEDIPHYKKWRAYIRQNIKNDEILTAQFNRIKDFLSLRETEASLGPIQFFFTYIRSHAPALERGRTDLFEIIFKAYVTQTAHLIYNDEVVETIRVLTKIFYEVKTYQSLKEYKRYFREFKLQSKIYTFLSLREFIHNIRWLRNFTYIGPSYKVNWRVIGIETYFCLFTFNPLLSKSQITKIITKLPFFFQSSSSESAFSIKVFGWFILPKKYRADLFTFLNNMEQSNYLYSIIRMHLSNNYNFLNLNYFREEFQTHKALIDRSHRAYDPKYEINFEMEYFVPERLTPLSLLDFIILDRIRYYSITGFSFDQTIEAMNTIKSDLFHEVTTQKKTLIDLSTVITRLREEEDMRIAFLTFIGKFKAHGLFFIIDLLNTILETSDTLITTIHNKNIASIYDLKQFISTHRVQYPHIYPNKTVSSILLQEIFPLYFTHRDQFFILKSHYQVFQKYLVLCTKLKLYSLNAITKLIQEKDLAKKVIRTKQKKLETIHHRNSSSTIKKEQIQDRLHQFIYSPHPLLKPMLTSTISVGIFARYFLHMLIRKTRNTEKKWNTLQTYFPRVIATKTSSKGEDLINIHVWIYNLKVSEKFRLISTLFITFRDDLLTLRRYFFDGFFDSYSRKDFYDFTTKEFFYTPDLFNEYWNYTKTIVGKVPNARPRMENSKEELFWDCSEEQINVLVEDIKSRIGREHINFDPTLLDQLKSFNRELSSYLTNIDELLLRKEEPFFTEYVDHIYYIPKYQKFGYSYYYLYILPSHLDVLDFKMALLNTFDELKYPGYIDTSKSLFIGYLFPYRKPNTSYLNWLTKSKKGVNEYCLFQITHLYHIFHFDFNLTSRGWEINPNQFKAFYQNIVEGNEYKIDPSSLREFRVGNLPSGQNYPPDSREHTILRNLYSFHKRDLKRDIHAKNTELSEDIAYLIEKDLIFPYLDIKNLGLIEELTIILPNLKNEYISFMVQIFSFFNYVFIYEIEGQYFLRGQPEETSFETGLLIQLCLPDCDLGALIRHFHEIFQAFEIEKYLILSDLLDGRPLLGNIYGDAECLEDYNPYCNLEWNRNDKIWVNEKLFDEEFTFIYPRLYKGKKEN